jgi:hypothetical protein
VPWSALERLGAPMSVKEGLGGGLVGLVGLVGLGAPKTP